MTLGWLDAYCVGWTLWTLRTLWSVWTLWMVWTFCTVWLYGVYGRRRGAQLTNFLFASTCILVFEHRAHVFPCKSRFRVFFPPRSFRRPRAFSPFPLKRVRGKKKKNSIYSIARQSNLSTLVRDLRFAGRGLGTAGSVLDVRCAVGGHGAPFSAAPAALALIFFDRVLLYYCAP